MSCVVTRKDHRLIEIDRRNAGYEGMYVTRWCRDCGAVVVDTDIDGHTYPGRGVAMRFPKLALDAAPSTRADNQTQTTTEKD